MRHIFPPVQQKICQVQRDSFHLALPLLFVWASWAQLHLLLCVILKRPKPLQGWISPPAQNIMLCTEMLVKLFCCFHAASKTPDLKLQRNLSSLCIAPLLLCYRNLPFMRQIQEQEGEENVVRLRSCMYLEMSNISSANYWFSLAQKWKYFWFPKTKMWVASRDVILWFYVNFVLLNVFCFEETKPVAWLASNFPLAVCRFELMIVWKMLISEEGTTTPVLDLLPKVPEQGNTAPCRGHFWAFKNATLHPLFSFWPACP